MHTASEVSGDIVAVLIVVMILLAIGAMWVWGMALIAAKVIQSLHYIRNGAPDYKYLQRLEHLLMVDNVQRIFEREAEERNQR